MSHTPKVSLSLHCCSRLELHSNSVLFIYYIHIELVSREPSIIWVTPVQMYPTWSVGKFEQVWTSIWGLSGNRRRRKETERRKFSQSGGWDRALCWFLLSLCEVSRLSAPSLSLFAGRMGGEQRVGVDERGISLTKSVSTTKRRLYKIPLIPTQWCHTNHSPALNCCVEKKIVLICRRHTSFFAFFSQAGLIEIPLISSSLKSLRILRY